MRLLRTGAVFEFSSFMAVGHAEARGMVARRRERILMCVCEEVEVGGLGAKA